MKTAKPKESPVERMIRMKTQLIANAQKKIEQIRANRDEQIAKIELRIKMNRVLIEALKKGQM